MLGLLLLVYVILLKGRIFQGQLTPPMRPSTVHEVEKWDIRDAENIGEKEEKIQSQREYRVATRKEISKL